MRGAPKKRNSKKVETALKEARTPTGTQKAMDEEGNFLLAKAGQKLRFAGDEKQFKRGQDMLVRGVLGMSNPEERKGYKKGGLVRGCGIAKRGFGKAMKGK